MRSDHPHDQVVESPSRSSAKITRKKIQKIKEQIKDKNKGVII